MTDEKVKEPVERLKAALADRMIHSTDDHCNLMTPVRQADLRAILSNHDALQAERDKLAAEVEASHQRFVDANEARLDAEAKLTALVEALEFYADPETYHALIVFADPPCGEFADDWSEDHGHPDYDRPMFGKRARQALAHHSAPVGEGEPVCVLCGAVNADPRPWDQREPVCPDCQDRSGPRPAPPSTPTEGAQLRPRAELLGMIDRIVAGSSADDPTLDLEMLSALSEAAERIRADTPALIQPQGEERS